MDMKMSICSHVMYALQNYKRSIVVSNVWVEGRHQHQRTLHVLLDVAFVGLNDRASAKVYDRWVNKKYWRLLLLRLLLLRLLLTTHIIIQWKHNQVIFNLQRRQRRSGQWMPHMHQQEYQWNVWRCGSSWAWTRWAGDGPAAAYCWQINLLFTRLKCTQNIFTKQ